MVLVICTRKHPAATVPEEAGVAEPTMLGDIAAKVKVCADKGQGALVP